MLSRELPLPYTILVLDVERYGDPARTDAHRAAVHNGLNRALRRAFAAAAVRWDSCVWQDGGDGALILIPSTTSKVVVLDVVVRHLAGEVRQHNEVSSPEARIGLRLCLHAADVRRTDYGVAGVGIILTSRLNESAELREARRDSTEPVILAVTDEFFREVVAHHPTAEPEKFRKIRFKVKEIDATAWVKAVAPALSSAPAAPVLEDVDDMTALVDALMEVPSLQDEVARRTVLDQLPTSIAGAVRHHPRARLHLFELVRTCRDYERGVDALFAVLRKLEGNSAPVLRAEAAAHQWMRSSGEIG